MSCSPSRQRCCCTWSGSPPSRPHGGWCRLYQSLVLDLVLTTFNLLPIPPLDGSRILLSVMPGELARPYPKPERFGLLILLGLVFVVPMAARQFGVASS